MRRAVMLAVVPVMVAAGPCNAPPEPAVEPDPATIALAHAPMHYQDTDHTDALSDYLTAVDYDGTWSSLDSWDNLGDPSTWTTGTDAYVYYSVVESCTHWFVIYMFFHPRDWEEVDIGQHENDNEAALLVIRKDGSPTGTLEGMITVFHRDFYSYTPPGSPLTDGEEDIDGLVSFSDVGGSPRPLTAQEARGHGLKAFPYAGQFTDLGLDDGITYIPGAVAQSPPSGNSRDVSYALVDLQQTLWLLQLLGGSPYDGNWGNFQGDSSGDCGGCSNDSANSPWSFNDKDDGSGSGVMALDPARLVEDYFSNLGAFSRHYVSNFYLEDLRDIGATDASPPRGFPSDFSLDEAYRLLDAQCPQTEPPQGPGR